MTRLPKAQSPMQGTSPWGMTQNRNGGTGDRYAVGTSAETMNRGKGLLNVQSTPSDGGEAARNALRRSMRVKPRSGTRSRLTGSQSYAQTPRRY